MSDKDLMLLLRVVGVTIGTITLALLWYAYHNGYRWGTEVVLVGVVVNLILTYWVSRLSGRVKQAEKR